MWPLFSNIIFGLWSLGFGLWALGFVFLVSQILVRTFLGSFFTANNHKVITMAFNALW